MLSGLAQAYDYSYDYSVNSTSDPGGLAGLAIFSGFFMIVWLVVAVFMIFAMWKVFEKAGEQGWKAIVPVYNTWTLAEISGRPGWWGLASLVGVIAWIPVLGWLAVIAAMVVFVLIYIDLAKSFGKDPVYAVLLILLPIVGLPLLAFDKNTKYVGPGGKAKGSSKPAAPEAPASTSK